MADKDTDEAMIVVASQEGVYGSYRKVGEKFALTDKAHFSTRWMVDVKEDPKKADQYAEQFKERGGLSRTNEEIEAELAVATGRSNAADAKKIARLEKENAELRKQVEDLQVEVNNASDLDVGDQDADEDEDDAPAKTDDAPRARRTRRAAS